LAAVAITAAMVGFTASAQEIDTAKRADLLTGANSIYYNLREAGLKSFRCEVDVDWQSIFVSASGKKVPEDDPYLKYLRSARISVTSDLMAKPRIDWANIGTPPQDKEKDATRLQGGVRSMLEGFLSSWAPSLNGTLINQKPKSMELTGKNYVVRAMDGDSETLDKNLRLTHTSMTTSDLRAEMDTDFIKSPEGLLLIKLDGTYQQPPTAPGSHVIMSTTYQNVGAFHLPEKIKLTVEKVAAVSMTLTACTVQKQP
jgi:hypothetical protein